MKPVQACFFLLVTIILLTSIGCERESKLFELVSSKDTNIEFKNTISDNDTFNVLRFEYIYNGGGVGIGDINNDGTADIFFTGNMVSSRLYLNRGDFKFEDVTQTAGVSTKVWCAGVAIVDINNDSLLDIYISTKQPLREKKGVPNLCFINQGIDKKGVPHFKELAAAVGLADSSYGSQATFLDYDKDGDLDVYLLTNSLEDYNRNGLTGQNHSGHGKSVDKIYRNEGLQGNGLPKFVDVSKDAGILTEGWGLGVIVNDFNNDNYPDIYAANDFMTNDHLYINQQNGTFKNDIAKALKHQEMNGMGVDVADINNDALNDIIVMDMMPDDNLRQKTMFPLINHERFLMNRQMNYQDQYIRNVLQLNNGNGTFSDIGYMANVYGTDWSWAPLFADFDNDGFRDLFITNGFPKDVTDLDFINYSRESSMFGTDETKIKNAMDAVKELVGVKKPNFLFHNNGDLTFSDQSEAWGLSAPSFSNGAAYADLDNDGDLDIVVNNINDAAFIYKNNCIGKDNNANNHFLRLKFKNEMNNGNGLGVKVWIYIGKKVIYAEHQQQRGYLSNVEATEHFGLGDKEQVDSLIIQWPSNKVSKLTNVKANQVLTLHEKDASLSGLTSHTNAIEPIFSVANSLYNLNYKHEERNFIDFKQGQPLIPHKHSQIGPGIAVGDINGDGLEDFCVGGSATYSATVFYQNKDHSFRSNSLPTKDFEDTGILLFDTDSDGDLDMYCVSGSSEFGRNTKMMQDRLFKNDGKGNFIIDAQALPVITSSGGSVIAADYDKDGDLDVFVGGRIRPREYPLPAESLLLQNNGKGKFTDVTDQVSPSLKTVGLVTQALWSDFNNDNWLDLVIIGEWMAPTFMENKKGKTFLPLPAEQFKHLTGWWNSLVAGDFDNDGDTDYVGGNLGLNSLYKASEEQPITVRYKDFDDNGSIDPVLLRYVQGKEYPSHPRETMTEQMVGLRRILIRYSIYGQSTYDDIFGSKGKDANTYQAREFRSMYFENLGDGTFKAKALPNIVQSSPAFGMLAKDINGDGNLDLLLVGNDYGNEVLSGLYDAGTGYYLQGDGTGSFTALTIKESGFCVDGDAKGFAEIVLGNGKNLYLITQNRDSIRVFKEPESKQSGILYKGHPLDVAIEIKLADGRKRKTEFYYGSTYLSQSSRFVLIPENAVSALVYNTRGDKRRVK